MFLVSHLLNNANISKILTSTINGLPKESPKVRQSDAMKDKDFTPPVYHLTNQQIIQHDCKANLFAHLIIYK